MQPYYQDADCTLFHGDCRDVLPRLERGSVDLILTDPPYGVHWNGTSMRTRMQFGPIANDDGTLPLTDILRAALNTLRRGRHIYCFGLRDYMDLPIGGQTELIWDKGILGPGDLTRPWGPSHEPIAFGVHQPSRANREASAGQLSARLRRGSVLRSQRANGCAVTTHPTEKPVDILRQMIESSTVWGECVLDPFAGSGSTLVAAKLEGRKSIGIEVEEKYCAVAVRRLAQQVLPLEVA